MRSSFPTNLALLGEHLLSWPRAYATRESIERYQLGKLTHLLASHALETPYYRRRFAEAGFVPEQLRTFDDIRRIPISTKADFQAAGFENRLSRPGPNADLIIHETSGSTGEVLRVGRSAGEELRYFGRRLRAAMLSGLRPLDRRVLFGAEPTQTIAHQAGLFRVSNIDLSTEPGAAVDILERIRPDIVKGPPGVLERLATELPERAAELRLRRVFCGAEQLTPKSRELIERVFSCPVVDFYGATECNLIAWECLRCGRYHTCDDGVIVEVLCDGRAARPGEEGEVVVTALHSERMPIIRYQVGDIARLPSERAPCSIGFGTIASIRGRIVDYLSFGPGESVSPYTLMDELDVMDAVRRYEIRQTSRRAITVSVQFEPSAQVDTAIREVKMRCQSVLPADVVVRADVVRSIPQDPERKRRFVVALPLEDG